MRRKRVLILLIVLAIVSLLISSALVLRNDTTQAKESETQEETYNGIIAEYGGNGVCEIIVEMGNVERSATTYNNIRIKNNSDTPLQLLDYTTQCRCMWLEFSRETIACGESIDVGLMFDTRGEWGEVGNYMEIITSTQDAPIVLWIAATIP